MENLPEDILFLIPDFIQNSLNKIKLANCLLICCKYFKPVFIKKINYYLSEFNLNLDKLTKKSRANSRNLLSQFIWSVTKKSVVPESSKYIPSLKIAYLGLLYNKSDILTNLTSYIMGALGDKRFRNYIADIDVLAGYTGNTQLIKAVKYNNNYIPDFLVLGLLLGGHVELLQTKYWGDLNFRTNKTTKLFAEFYNSNPKNKILNKIPFVGLATMTTPRDSNSYINLPYNLHPSLILAEINKTPLKLESDFPFNILIMNNYNFLLKNFLIDHGFNININYDKILILCDRYHNYYAFRLLVKYTNIKPSFCKYQDIFYNQMLKQYFIQNIGILDKIQLGINYLQQDNFSYISTHIFLGLSSFLLVFYLSKNINQPI